MSANDERNGCWESAASSFKHPEVLPWLKRRVKMSSNDERSWCWESKGSMAEDDEP